MLSTKGKITPRSILFPGPNPSPVPHRLVTWYEWHERDLGSVASWDLRFLALLVFWAVLQTPTRASRTDQTLASLFVDTIQAIHCEWLFPRELIIEVGRSNRNASRVALGSPPFSTSTPSPSFCNVLSRLPNEHKKRKAWEPARRVIPNSSLLVIIWTHNDNTVLRIYLKDIVSSNDMLANCGR